MDKIIEADYEMMGVNSALQEKEKNQEHALTAHNMIRALKEALQMNFLKLGAYLKLVHDENYYLFIDGGYNTWQDYLDSPEIDLSRSQAYKLMAVYDRWMVKYNYSAEVIKDISIEKLYIASSQANETNHGEWLEKARLLSRADLKAETPGGRQFKSYIYCPKCEHLILIESDMIVHMKEE